MLKLKIVTLICICITVFVISFQPIAVGRSENDGLACELEMVFEDEDANLIQWSLDGNYLLNTLRYDSTFSIWDMESRTKIRSLGPSNDARPKAIAWRTDGQQIATIYPLYNVEIWDIEVGEAIADFETYEAIDQEVYEQNLYSLAWHPDGETLAIVHDLNISLLDLQTGDLTTIYHVRGEGHAQYGAIQASWVENGSRLAVANSNGTVSFLEADDPNQEIITQNDTYFSTSPVSLGYSMSFNASRTIVAVAGYSYLVQDSAVILYDVENLESLNVIDKRRNYWVSDMIRAIGWSAKDDILAIGRETQLTVNSFNDDFSVRDVAKCGTTEGVRSLAWHPTENILASVDWDGDIRFWRVEDG